MHVVYGVYVDNTRCTKTPPLHRKAYVENTTTKKSGAVTILWGNYSFVQQYPAIFFVCALN